MSEQTAFTIFSGAALILILLPLPWHWNARNYGTLLYIAWTFVGNLMYFVNSIIWHGNLSNPVPVWCDITTKLAMGLGVALPAVSLCINRRLYNIATMKSASVSPRHRLKQTLIDFGIGLGLPCLVMILHYVVQGHRYNIIEDIGCAPATYATPLMIPLVLMWPPLLGLVSMVYGALAIHAFVKQRRTLNAVLSAHNSNLNVSRYLRLMALAGTDILLDLPLSTFIMWSNIRPGLHPWISWANTHYNFSYVGYFPRKLLQMNETAFIAISINRWALPMASILFFLYFGLAGESLAAYRRAFERLRKLIPFTKPSPSLAQVASSIGTPSPRRTSFGARSPRTPHAHTQDGDLESSFTSDELKSVNSSVPQTPDMFKSALGSVSTEKFVTLPTPSVPRVPEVIALPVLRGNPHELDTPTDSYSLDDVVSDEPPSSFSSPQLHFYSQQASFPSPSLTFTRISLDEARGPHIFGRGI